MQKHRTVTVVRVPSCAAGLKVRLLFMSFLYLPHEGSCRELLSPAGIFGNAVCHADCLSDDWSNQAEGLVPAGFRDTPEWFIPGMIDQRKFTDMCGKQVSGTKVSGCCDRLFRHHVDIRPRVRCTDRSSAERGQYRQGVSADFSKMGSIAAVTAEEDFLEGDSSRKPAHRLLFRVRERPE